MRYPRAYYEESRQLRERLADLAACLHGIFAEWGFRWQIDRSPLRHGLPNYIRVGDGNHMRGGDSILIYLREDDTFRLSLPCCDARMIFHDGQIEYAAGVAAEHLKYGVCSCRPYYQTPAKVLTITV